MLCYTAFMKLWEVITIVICILAGSLAPSVVSSAPKYEVEYNPCDGTSYSDTLFCSVNKYRADNNLKTLKYSSEATRIAKNRAVHLCQTNTFTHEGWETFLNTDYIQAGENLAKEFDNQEDVLNGWINSPAHNENLLNSWGSMGIYTEPCDGRNVTAQIFLTLE